MDPGKCLSSIELCQFAHFSEDDDLNTHLRRTFTHGDKYPLMWHYSNMKPNGLFFARNNEWLEWELEHVFINDSKYKYSIHSQSCKNLKIYSIDDVKELVKCFKKYTYNVTIEGKVHILHDNTGRYNSHMSDWSLLRKKDYDGVHFTRNLINERYTLHPNPDSVEYACYKLICCLDVETIVIWNLKELSLVRENFDIDKF